MMLQTGTKMLCSRLSHVTQNSSSVECENEVILFRMSIFFQGVVLHLVTCSKLTLMLIPVNMQV